MVGKEAEGCEEEGEEWYCAEVEDERAEGG